ncbi:MAG TPA: hypothetical protein VIW45_18065 [Vicinamibacterales bacterium]
MPLALLATLAATLTFTPPAGWRSSNPSSSMRLAEFTLSPAAGDADDAQLVVYYVGGSGGSLDANITHWIAQMELTGPRKTIARWEAAFTAVVASMEFK